MLKTKLIGIIPGLLMLWSPPALFAETDEAATAIDGLQLVEKDSRGAIYADPDADWSQYSKIKLEGATVAFRKNWLRDQNRNRRSLSDRVSTQDMERIRTGMAELFNEVFVAELAENGGWEIVDTAGPDVLQIQPQIVDLDVYAPDTRSSTVSRTYTDSAGKMTLKLQLFDSETGDLIASASDRREAPHRGYMQWTNSISNRSEARTMLQRWAKALNERLAEATGAAQAD